jgi:hypothetical protein
MLRCVVLEGELAQRDDQGTRGMTQRQINSESVRGVVKVQERKCYCVSEVQM